MSRLEPEWQRTDLRSLKPHMRDESLGDFIARFARNASDGRLVLQAGVGLLGVAAALLWRGPGSEVVVSLSVALASFSGWGILDRELQERSSSLDDDRHLLLRAARAGTAILGAAAALGVLFAGFRLTLGTWVS